MILRKLYDYYHHSDNMPNMGCEFKEIQFLIVLSKDGDFLRFEDCRIDNRLSRSYRVIKDIDRTSNICANYFYDKPKYILGYPKGKGKEYDAFTEVVNVTYKKDPTNSDIRAIMAFYSQGSDAILSKVQADPYWSEIAKRLNSYYLSFRIEGDTKIVAEKDEIINLFDDSEEKVEGICMVTGEKTEISRCHSMIKFGNEKCSLVSFNFPSALSDGESQAYNAPVSKEAVFAYTTALNYFLSEKSHNKRTIGDRTFVFWSSDSNALTEQAEKGTFEFFCNSETDKLPDNSHKQVQSVFQSIYNGSLKTTLCNHFYILGLAQNHGRLVVVYWLDILLKNFAKNILRHFNDMEIADFRKEKKPYMGLWHMLSAVNISDKASDVSPNLPEAVAKSIWQGTPYPFTLYSACLRRIKAKHKPSSSSKNTHAASNESKQKQDRQITITRVAILKAYLIRKQYLNSNITVMLDKENTNQGYLLGRLFAVLVKIQEDANGIDSMRERYMNAASTTPATVFATVMNLSVHHAEKLSEGSKIYYEKLKQEIISKLPAGYVAAHLDLQEQGCFFIGYYHQRQDFFTSKDNNNQQNNKN